LYGKTYVMPASAAKPGDPRFGPKPQVSLCSAYADILAETVRPVPCDDPNAFLETIKDERVRRQYDADTAYMRGDFERTLHCYRETEGDEAARLRAASIAIAAAISLGDYHFFQLIENYLKSIAQAGICPEITAVAETSLATAYVSALAPNMVADWLKDGNLRVLSHPMLRLDAAYKRARYFQGLRDYASMLAVAQTALAFGAVEDEISMTDIYLRIVCAIACYETGRQNDAKNYIHHLLDKCLPHGIVTPFAENALMLGGFVEELLKGEFPAYYDAVMEQSKRTVTHWVSFHNSFTKDNITQILSIREAHIAKLAARGASDAQIGQQFHLAPGTVKNHVDTICQKLFVSGNGRRKKLAKFFL
jgi:hypothetical protein